MVILLLDRTDQKITGTRSRVELIQIYFYLANLVDVPDGSRRDLTVGIRPFDHLTRLQMTFFADL